MTLSKIIKKLVLTAIGTIQFTTLWANPKTIAILPFSFENSRIVPEKTVKDTVQKVLEKSGLTVINNESILQLWERDLKLQKPKSIPNNDSLIELGEKLNVDYVCAGTVHWTIRTPWIGIGPKLKAECKVNCKIIDVKKKKAVLNAKDVVADSRRKESGWEIAGDILITPLISMVNPGQRTPHMNRSGQIATLMALSDFTKKIKAQKSKSKSNSREE